MVADSDSSMVVGCQLSEGGTRGQDERTVGRSPLPALSSSRTNMTSDNTGII
jgi:hypothetical protein